MDVIREYWNQIAAFGFAFAFIVRMEMALRFQGKELTRLEKQRDKDVEDSRVSRNETHAMLHDMNAKLDRLIERNLR